MKAIVCSGIFVPSMKVKILSRYFDETYKVWRCICKVTSRKNRYYKLGEEIHPRIGELFLKERVQRNSGGKLYWEGKPDLEKIPFFSSGEKK